MRYPNEQNGPRNDERECDNGQRWINGDRGGKHYRELHQHGQRRQNSHQHVRDSIGVGGHAKLLLPHRQRFDRIERQLPQMAVHFSPQVMLKQLLGCVVQKRARRHQYVNDREGARHASDNQTKG